MIINAQANVTVNIKLFEHRKFPLSSFASKMKKRLLQLKDAFLIVFAVNTD